jgi:hypothetical protein
MKKTLAEAISSLPAFHFKNDGCIGKKFGLRHQIKTKHNEQNYL